MNYCETCDWWREDKYAKMKKYAHLGYPARVCECPKIVYMDGEPEEPDGANWSSYEGQGILWEPGDFPRFTPGPRFYCPHHSDGQPD